MKHWCKLKTDTINNETLFELPESAQLCYYKLHAIAAMCDAGGALVKDDGSPLTIKGLAFRLHSTEEATGYNIAALIRARLISQIDGIISLPDFECEAADYTNAERQRRFRESKKALQNVTEPVTVTPDENSNGVTVTPVTPLRNTEEKRRDENRIDVAGKKNDQPKSDPAAAEPESIKLWREWTLHTGKIAPTFFERLTNEVKDIDVWADTLAFGAKNRKIAHTNTGLDWALTNYKTGVAQKRANALTKNQSNVGNGGGKYADKLVETEIDGVKVYYG